MQLESAGIDTSKFGQGEAKTLAHLQKEIDAGESVLLVNENGELLRTVEGSKAHVFYSSPEGKLFKLKELKQIFKDGRERVRDYLPQSVSEKMVPGEDPISVMKRGLQEELGIDGSIDLQEKETQKQLKKSPSYPGLQSQYINHMFEVFLTDNQFKQEGYQEVQEDKTTYFIWEEVK